MERTIRNVDIYFSGICNMKCNYCYIHKSECLKEINNNIRATIADREIIENGLCKFVNKEEISELSLWGAEPTLNSDLAEDMFKVWFSIFNNCETVSMSTNMLKSVESVIEIIMAVEHNAPLLKSKVTFELQISIDGPAWVTDVNRQAGATEKIVQNYLLLMEYLNANKGLFSNIERIDIDFKPTLTTENMALMLSDNEKLLDWFLFGNSLVESFKSQYDDNDLFFVNEPPRPTVVNVGLHTVEDGKIFSQWLERIYFIKDDRLTHYKGSLFTQFFKELDRMFIHSVQEPHRFHGWTCGGGNSSIAMNYNGDIFSCHRAFQFDNPDDSTVARGLLKNTYSANPGNRTEMERLDYVLRGYHDFITTRKEFNRSMIERLALYGQADKEYLENEQLLETLATFLTATSCYIDASSKTGSLNLPALSFVRLFGNGAFQVLFCEWARKRGVK